MERLTEDSVTGETYIKQCASSCPYDGDFCGTDECPVLNAVADKLGEYERAEEQGLLVRLPVEIGTELFQPCADRKSIIRSIVINNTITDDDIYIGIVDERGNERHYSKKSIGKTVFLTREEAEKKLEEMKNE